MAATENQAKTTILHSWHVDAGASMLEFGGFDMPVQYDTVFGEHLATRTKAGLFDVSHMGRFIVSGAGAVPFLQYTLTNNVLELREAGRAQYTMIPDEHGGALDDAYIYRTGREEYMLVVNAANRDADWAWLTEHLGRFDNVDLVDRSDDTAMLALQGPESERVLEELLDRIRCATPCPACASPGPMSLSREPDTPGSPWPSRSSRRPRLPSVCGRRYSRSASREASFPLASGLATL